MKMKVVKMCLPVALALSSAAVFANPAAESAEERLPQGPLHIDGYMAILGSYIWGEGERLEEATGGTILLGKRNGRTALEIGGFVFDYPESSKSFGGHIAGLYFPMDSLPNTFGVLGLGMQEIEDYPTTETGTLAERDDLNMSMLFAQAGVGQLWPITFGRYEFALRTDVMYRMSKRDKVQRENREDIDAPRRFDEVVANVGFQLPFGLLPPPEPAAPPPQVIEPVAPPDTDADGVNDAVDQCPSSAPGDIVDGTGCVPPPPKPSCKSPLEGERISLEGCSKGDAIVLRGVHFSTASAELTSDAKSILNQVSEELKAHPAISVEIAGHTDARGDDAYNQQLSESRATSVTDYLVLMGVAADRMSAIGYGEQQPVADNDSEVGRERNRRVALMVTERAEPGMEPASEMPPAEADEAN
ncbi:MAG: OmpA family protein [Sinimarinibacterium sp.]|jgi:outer membrane protein OmpA-like peptidoglycan-associated protein